MQPATDHLQRPVSDRISDALQRHSAPILLLALIKIILIYHAYAAGFRLLANDESCRWHMACGWMGSPFFAPWDHVWPGGYFYLAGAWMWVFGTSFIAAKMLPITLSVLSAAGLYMAGYQLFQSRVCGFVGALLCLGGYVNTWISMSFMPEIMAITFTSWGVYFAFRGLSNGSIRSLSLGSFILGLTASFRYEQWFLLAAYQVILLIVLIMEPKRWRQIILAGFLSSLYIGLWMGSSWLRYGNPLAFFRNSQAVTITAEGNPVLAMFGHLMWWEGFIFKIALSAQVLALIFGTRQQRLYALWILGFGLLFIASLKVGTAAATWRIVQGWRCCLVLMTPILFQWLLQDRFGAPLTNVVRVLAVVGAFVYTGTQIPYAAKAPAWEFGKDTLALGDWLLFEQNDYAAGRPEFFKDRGFDRILHLGSGDQTRDFEDYWAISYFLGNPKLMRLASEPVEGDPNVIITRRDQPPPAGWEEARRIGRWRILTPLATPE